MLVKKKTPGKFRVMVDNRLVNADCKPPVGAMSASPLSINRMMNGAKIFTTLDIKNAFYCLLLAVPDCPYTAMSIPEVQGYNLRECQWVQKPQWQRSIKQ